MNTGHCMSLHPVSLVSLCPAGDSFVSMSMLHKTQSLQLQLLCSVWQSLVIVQRLLLGIRLMIHSRGFQTLEFGFYVGMQLKLCLNLVVKWVKFWFWIVASDQTSYIIFFECHNFRNFVLTNITCCDLDTMQKCNLHQCGVQKLRLLQRHWLPG